MVEAAMKLDLPSENGSSNPMEISKSSKERVLETHTHEVVFALCGYMGTNISNVVNSIAFIMENDYGYDCQIIKLSKFIELNRPQDQNNAIGSKEYVRIKNLIQDGNSLREKHGLAILAELAIQTIGLDRLSKAEKIETDNHETKYVFKPRKKCYIIDSLKNPNELAVLKEIYRDLIYTIGVFSSYKVRHENLIQKEIVEKEIAELIDQDSHEEVPHGQDVRETFTKSDYFLRIEHSAKNILDLKLKRFIHLIFGTEIITPTSDETAMYFASSAAANSACLSRQVGASITDANGNLISVGWNDVPCFMGNLYMHSTSDIQNTNDNRCLNFQNGKCMNDDHKQRISSKLIDELKRNNCIADEKEELALKIIQSSKLKSLIEFSRAIHAEMHAIIIGCQKTGGQMIGGKLFVTTYPCHNCARHIVLSGIREVYFIEPYSKSLATVLHSDSITDDEREDSKVKILLYDGVAPSRYLDLFKMNGIQRKDHSGSVNKTKMKEATPRYTLTLEALYTLESTATKNLAVLNLKI